MAFLLKHLRSQLAPSPSSLAIAWAAVWALGIGSACSGLMGLTSESDPGFNITAILIGFFVLPAFALIMAVAAVRERRVPPRAWMWAASALGVGTAGLVVASYMASDPTMGLDVVGTFLLLLCSPVVFAFSLPAVYNLAKAWPEVRLLLHIDRVRRTVEMVEARGEVAFADLAGELGVPEADVGEIFDGLLKSGRLVGTLDFPRKVFFSTAGLAERQRQLLGVVQARGQVHLDELARELRAPRELIEDWIQQLVRRGEFTGYINWAEGTLYSADAEKLRGGSRCPHCGGELGLAGKGVIRCGHCGSEVFLAP